MNEKQLYTKAKEAEESYLEAFRILESNIKRGWFESAEKNLQEVRTTRFEWDRARRLLSAVQSNDRWCIIAVDTHVYERTMYCVTEGRLVSLDIAEAMTFTSAEDAQEWVRRLKDEPVLCNYELAAAYYGAMVKQFTEQ